MKNGIAKDVANFVFTKIEPFAQYGFNKSHAAAYALIAYQTAFLKTYYKEDFIADHNVDRTYKHFQITRICRRIEKT